MPVTGRPPEPMIIELNAESSAVIAKYAELKGHTRDGFLNRYLSDNMIALFENARSGELESHLGKIEYRTCADAERVVAWMESRVTRSLQWRTASGAEIFADPKTGVFGSINRNHLMRKMAIFSAVLFLTIASLLLCSCSDVDEGQGPSHESHYSKVPGSGAVSY